jgi:hypothetical protein
MGTALRRAGRAAFGLLVAAVSHQPLAAQELKPFSSFADVRHELLSRMGEAKARIWMVTSFLTDGEIVSALYLAQYRKLQVGVLLGRQKANTYMSRLNYLKEQNIPVFLKPDEIKFGAPTAVLVDNRLFLVDSDLDFMDRRTHFVVTSAVPEDAEKFVETFLKATERGIPAVPRAMPIVGRPGARPRATGGVSLPRSVPKYDPGEVEGSYSYDNARISSMAAPPPGVPKVLPRETILEQRGKQSARPPAPAVTPPKTDIRASQGAEGRPPDIQSEED